MKRKSQGFNGGKNLVVYIGKSSQGSVRKEIIDACREAWNECSISWLIKSKRKVSQINFEFRASSTRFGADWNSETEKIRVFDFSYVSTSKQSLSWYKGTMYHEMAHCWYDNEKRLDTMGNFDRFIEICEQNQPITEYTRDNRQRWGRYLYANEIHSAITEHLYSENRATLGSGENLDRLIEAFNQLHEVTG